MFLPDFFYNTGFLGLSFAPILFFAISTALSIAAFAFVLWAFYMVIRRAVRNGILDAEHERSHRAALADAARPAPGIEKA